MHGHLTAPSLQTRLLAFIRGLSFDDLPHDVVTTAKRCLLDLIGVAAGGAQMELSRIARNFAAAQMAAAGGGPRMLFDGRRVSPTGAAYAGASTIDALDGHDGHRLTKGHAGVALLPALLAFADYRDRKLDGREFAAALVVGYEIAIRAGITLHATTPDYHTSGAWNAIGCAAMGARLLELDEWATRHALGAAEYHGPRSQMMRCIDHPTMVKDGSGWGALAGVSAAYLAAEGFTGAPALLMEGEAAAPGWRDLGSRWEIAGQYFKPYPVCRWSQPAMQAAADLMAQYRPALPDIAAVEIRTFAEAVRLGTRPPRNTEEAQYAIGFPVAAIIARGKLGVVELSDAGLHDAEIGAVLDRIRLAEEAAFSAQFPQQRLAIVQITLKDGTQLASPPTAARGDPEDALSDHEMLAKFRQLGDVLGSARLRTIEQSVFALDSDPAALAALMDAILTPI